jgi:hypothetical protein
MDAPRHGRPGVASMACREPKWKRRRSRPGSRDRDTTGQFFAVTRRGPQPETTRMCSPSPSVLQSMTSKPASWSRAVARCQPASAPPPARSARSTDHSWRDTVERHHRELHGATPFRALELRRTFETATAATTPLTMTAQSTATLCCQSAPPGTTRSTGPASCVCQSRSRRLCILITSFDHAPIGVSAPGPEGPWHRSPRAVPIGPVSTAARCAKRRESPSRCQPHGSRPPPPDHRLLEARCPGAVA